MFSVPVIYGHGSFKLISGVFFAGVNLPAAIWLLTKNRFVSPLPIFGLVGYFYLAAIIFAIIYSSNNGNLTGSLSIRV